MAQRLSETFQNNENVSLCPVSFLEYLTVLGLTNQMAFIPNKTIKERLAFQHTCL